MFRQVDVALQAFKAFIKMTHCPGDRGAMGTFNDSLLWVQELESGKAGLGNCLDDIETSGGTRLYDSLCDAVDYLNEHGDGSRPWYIFALTYNNDDKSTRSAKECGKYIFENYASRYNKCCVVVISVGKDVSCDELNGIEIDKCLYHVHVRSSAQLEDSMLWKISFGNIIGDRNYEMDYVALVNNSASMGILRHPKQLSSGFGQNQSEGSGSRHYSELVPPAQPRETTSAPSGPTPANMRLSSPVGRTSLRSAFVLSPVERRTRAKEGTSHAQSSCPEPRRRGAFAVTEHAGESLHDESQDSVQDSYMTQRPESSDAESRPQPVSPVLSARLVPPALPASLLARLRAPARVTIRMREFTNKDLHPSDRQIFREFAVKNYPNIPNSWEEEKIEFLVLVESAAKSIVGLLVMLPYDDGRAHIRLMVVSEEYRKHGLGTKMLSYVAGKYRNRTVTLNVAFDRLDLLNFYYDKGYVKFEEFSTEHKVIVFSLVHLKLLATMPFPG